MTLTKIDPKYAIAAPGPASIVKVTSPSDAIPEEEPLILFRARDWHALAALKHYALVCMEDGCTDFHMDGIRKQERGAAESGERPNK